MLSALSQVGRSGAGCLGKVLGALAAKKAIDEAKIARGLESILAGQSERSVYRKPGPCGSGHISTLKVSLYASVSLCNACR